MPFTKRISVLLIAIVIKLAYSVSITGLIDVQDPNGHMLLLPGMKRTSDLRSEGIFERFIRNLLDLLTTTFPEKKLPKYCRILKRHIEPLNFKHAQKFAKHLKYLSRMYLDDLKHELISYITELDKKKKHLLAFLDAFNKAFTLREHILFNDYIYDLKNYGSDDKLYIDEETQKLINNVIMGSINKRLSSSDRVDLQRKLRYAVKEYIKY